jgi:hypothetical protein
MPRRFGVTVEKYRYVLERSNEPLEMRRICMSQHDRRELGHDDAPFILETEFGDISNPKPHLLWSLRDNDLSS